MKQILKYDEKSLSRRLGKLKPKTRALFAYLAALRLLPSCRLYMDVSGGGSFDRVRNYSELLWRDLSNQEMLTKVNMETACEKLLALFPEPGAVTFNAFAEGAVSSLIYAFRARLGNETQEAAWAARCLYDAMDHFAQNETVLRTTDPRYEEALLEHEQVQAELFRQQRDLRDLEEWERNGSLPNVLAGFKSRSEQEAPLLS